MKAYNKHIEYRLHVIASFKKIDVHNGVTIVIKYRNIMCEPVHIHLN